MTASSAGLPSFQARPDGAGVDEGAAEDSKPIVASAHPSNPPASPRLQSIQVGDVLDDKYCLLHALSVGGMGTLFVAHNAVLDVRVAIKLIRRFEGDGGGDELDNRLLREARAAAQLGHPAIVRVHDFGRSPAGEPYIVMELLRGEDLGAALQRRGRIAPTQALRVLLPIAHALSTAHGRDIVHRDLKPANIFLSQTDDGTLQPKLIDFGVAKMHVPRGDRLTLVGATVGTPEYMSPELAHGEDVGADADIWAFCVVLYETVTGKLPFAGSNMLAQLRAIVDQEAPSIAVHGIDDPKLSAILERGLCKRREERWASMRELGRALAQLLLDRGVKEDIRGASLEATWWDADRGGAPMDALSSYPPPSTRSGPRSGLAGGGPPASARRVPDEAPGEGAPGGRPAPSPSRQEQRAVDPARADSTPRLPAVERAEVGARASRFPSHRRQGAPSAHRRSTALSCPDQPDPTLDARLAARAPSNAHLRAELAAEVRRAVLLGFGLVALAILLVGSAAAAVWLGMTSP